MSEQHYTCTPECRGAHAPDQSYKIPDRRGRAFYRAADGTETDITEAVAILWDGVIGSLDWGSGFWGAEDAAAVAWIGNVFGFRVPCAPHSYDKTWSPDSFAAAIADYERHRQEIDANLPEVWSRP